MTQFIKFLNSIGFKDLKNKSTIELISLLDQIYTYCDEQHGKVEGNFFTEDWKPNKSIKRGTLGLDVHHKFEYDPDNSEVCSLSDLITALYWFEKGYTKYQLAENLVYCNWIEHQTIHVLIDILRMRLVGVYRLGCIDRRAPILNRYYNYGEDYLNGFKSNTEYIKTSLRLIKDEFDTYQLIMTEWGECVGYEDWYLFGYEEDSLDNCFEID